MMFSPVMKTKRSLILELGLTAVCDPCPAEIKFNKLTAADQTFPHYGVSYLSTGQPQHLQDTSVFLIMT